MQSATHPVLQKVHQSLAESSHLFLRHIDIDFQDGRILLTGRVPSFYLKQLAQTVVRDVEGVSIVENNLSVVNPRGISSTRAVA